MSDLSNVQADAAEEIRSLLSAADQMERQSTEKQIAAGHQLVAAKAACGHGSWLPFLARAGVHERRAQRLMKLARSGLRSDTVSELGGVRQALEYVARRQLPDDGQALFIRTGDHSEPDAEFAVLMPSLTFPGHWYAAAIQGDTGVITPRPISAQPVQIDGEAPLWLIWHWLETRITAPVSEWRFETESLRLAAVILESFNLRSSEAIAVREQRHVEATCLHLLADQIDHFGAIRAA